jgi:cytochrome d ubiquinol oxidase subunit II
LVHDSRRLTALAALALHGALWVALKTEGAVNGRARQAARVLWWAVAAFTVLVTAVTFRVQPHVLVSLAARPWGYIFPLLALAGLLSVRWFLGRDDLRGFLSSCVYLLGMLTSVAFGLYPYVLPASTNPDYGLTVYNAKAADYGLRIGLVWWLMGMALATVYVVYVYRKFSSKVTLSEDGY